MDKEDVENEVRLPGDLHVAVTRALDMLQQYDAELFETRANVGTPQERGASERSASHRLALYLEVALKAANFDAEKGILNWLQDNPKVVSSNLTPATN